jgi:hypothetical protein
VHPPLPSEYVAGTLTASFSSVVGTFNARTSNLTKHALASARVVKRSIVKPALRSIALPVVELAAYRKPKHYSAMMRVKNEGEFLYRSVASIVDHVDEVVIVDNMSTDDTPEVIARLALDLPGKIKSVQYQHALARYGDENRTLGSTREGRRSPALLANYYNWCLAHCTHPFILKWDGDTVATAEFGPALAEFRTSPKQCLWHIGANLHQDGQHLIAGVPFEAPEPRLFYRRFAKYTNALGYCELLESPYVYPSERYVARAAEPLYVHMKYCKTDRFSNMSADLQAAALLLNAVGEPISPIVREAIERWHLGPAPATAD